MKRLSEESDANPQLKRPINSSSRNESSGPLHPTTSNEVRGGRDVANISCTQKLTTNDVFNYLHLVKDTFQDQRETYDHFLHLIEDFKSQRIALSGITQQVKELFQGHPNLIQGFKVFFPEGDEITLTDADGAPAPQKNDPELEAMSYIKKIKKRDASAHKSFLKILDMYGKLQKSISEVSQEVAALLVNHKDLLDEFTKFLPDTSARTVKDPRQIYRLKRHSSKPLNILEKKRDVQARKENDRYNTKILYPCHRCTPRYRLLRNNHPMSTASRRSHLGSEVLNYHWASVTSGRENYSSIHMQRNLYEDSLFKCEDDRFELDMLLESFRSFAKRVDELLNCMNHSSVGRGGPLCIDDHFTAIDVRCIERLYGDVAPYVMGIVRKNPSIALPIILTRLKQKQEEWADSGSQYACVWFDVCARNCYRKCT